MKQKVNLKIFKDYSIKTNEELDKYFAFWADYYSFREECKNANNNIKVSRSSLFNSSVVSKGIKNKAQSIFSDYFENYDKSSNTNKSSFLTIEFPIDIVNKLNEINQNDFNVDYPENIFNDAFIWIEEKLSDEFKKFKKDEKQMKKIKKFAFFNEIFDIY